ncbi:MAG: protein-L-isoaspartate(D-aspartate) O-methyltransferase [Thermoanaerobaculia bacterium]
MRRRGRPDLLLPAALAIVLMAGDAMAFEPQPDPFSTKRLEMVEKQIMRRGVTEPGVVGAMTDVPRHLFVPDSLQDQAYVDSPLSIGSGQTISQPYIVALMTSLLELEKGDRVLEIGTGSGYQAAVLARLVDEVYTIEIREALGRRAEKTLAELGFKNVHVRIGDGYKGWPEKAPFDGIIVTAAPERIPEPLLDQLKLGGRLVIPVGAFFQDLLVITKTPDGLEERKVAPVRFVPMIGEVEQQPQER